MQEGRREFVGTLSKSRRRYVSSDQTVKKPSGGVGGAAAPLTFLRVSRLCRLRGSLILLAKSIPYKFGRPLVDRICFLEKVASATFSTRWSEEVRPLRLFSYAPPGPRPRQGAFLFGGEAALATLPARFMHLHRRNIGKVSCRYIDGKPWRSRRNLHIPRRRQPPAGACWASPAGCVWRRPCGNGSGRC